MFGEIAPRYDFLNRLLSAGQDVAWRRRLVAALALKPDEKLLDVACGTADVAIEAKLQQPRCQVVGADPVVEMLYQARTKIPALHPVCGECEGLPFASATFNAATVAFGVRNFTYLEQGLEELHRVLVPGGRLGILEFALPDKGLLSGLYRWYLTTVLPGIGALFSRGYAYQYLPESISHFPAPVDFAALMESVGFTDVRLERLMGGAVWIYYGAKY